MLNLVQLKYELAKDSGKVREEMATTLNEMGLEGIRVTRFSFAPGSESQGTIWHKMTTSLHNHIPELKKHEWRVEEVAFSKETTVLEEEEGRDILNVHDPTKGCYVVLSWGPGGLSLRIICTDDSA